MVPSTIMSGDMLLISIVLVSVDLKVVVPQEETLAPRHKAGVH